MRGWRLTRRGDYINSELANRTRAAVVSLERSGLWAFVVRTPERARERAGQELSDGGCGHASRGGVHRAGQTEQRDRGAGEGPPERQKGKGIIGADKRTLRDRGRDRAAALPTAIAASTSLSLLITCSGVCSFLAIFPLFYGPILAFYPDQFGEQVILQNA